MRSLATVPDRMARLIGQHLTLTLGQGVVIDNRPGAGGTIGARAVAESDPDGYTLLLGNTSTLVISPLIYKNVNYDPVNGRTSPDNFGRLPFR